jgi:site-specific DNA recombinase
MAINAVGYVRVSSKDQIDNTSLDSQTSYLINYSKSQSLNLLKVFREEGKSAKTLDRPALNELRMFVRKNKVSKLLIYKYDRISRNASNFLILETELKSNGIEIISITEPIDHNPAGDLLKLIIAGIAQFNNTTLSERVSVGMRDKVMKDGIHISNTPVFYKKVNNICIPDTSFKVGRRAWEMLIHEKKKSNEIYKFLVENNIRSYRGNIITKQRLSDIFHNPFYAGFVKWKDEKRRGVHVPMITPQEFDEAQKVLAMHNNREYKAKHRKYSEQFWLAKVVKCNYCGEFLKGSYSKTNRGQNLKWGYYRCTNSFCVNPKKNYKKEFIENSYLKFLESIELKPEEIQICQNLIEKKLKNSGEDIDLLISTKNENLLRTQKKLERLKDLYLEGLIELQEFDEKDKILRFEIDVINKELSVLYNNCHYRYSVISSLKNLANLKESFMTWSSADKVKFNQALNPPGFFLTA